MGRLALHKDEQNGWFYGTGSLIIRFPKTKMECSIRTF